jgi:hypothetical protein
MLDDAWLQNKERKCGNAAYYLAQYSPKPPDSPHTANTHTHTREQTTFKWKKKERRRNI